MPWAAKQFGSKKKAGGQVRRTVAKRFGDRESACKRGYGRKWRKASKAYLREHPLCECQECTASGRVVASECVDHIVPHKGDEKLFWDTENWQAMSNKHHARKTAREDGGFGNK